MKPISFAWHRTGFLPQPSQSKETGNSDSQETPRNCFRRPPKNENKLIGQRPKCDCGYRHKQNIARATFGGPFRGHHRFHLGILWDSDSLQRLGWSAWRSALQSAAGQPHVGVLARKSKIVGKGYVMS